MITHILNAPNATNYAFSAMTLNAPVLNATKLYTNIMHVYETKLLNMIECNIKRMLCMHAE